MPGGFEYDPEAIRAFAEVFNQASTQVGEVRTTLADTSAKAGDFGNAWKQHGVDFESYLGALAEDLGNLATDLAGVAGQLAQGTELIVSADTSGLRNLKAIENGSGGAA